MKRLTAQQERFARLVASGKMSQREAYEAAGYKGGDKNSSQLANRPHIKAFIDQLRARAIHKSEVDLAYVITGLKKVADIGMRPAPFEPVDGIIKQKMTDATAATRALELLGKTMGAFVDRTQVELTESAKQYIEGVVRVLTDEVTDPDIIERIIARLESEIGAGGDPE